MDLKQCLDDVASGWVENVDEELPNGLNAERIAELFWGLNAVLSNEIVEVAGNTEWLLAFQRGVSEFVAEALLAEARYWAGRMMVERDEWKEQSEFQHDCWSKETRGRERLADERSQLQAELKELKDRINRDTFSILQQFRELEREKKALQAELAARPVRRCETCQSCGPVNDGYGDQDMCDKRVVGVIVNSAIVGCSEWETKDVDTGPALGQAPALPG